MLWLFGPNSDSNLVASRADRRASCPSMRPRHHRGNAHQCVLYERTCRVSGVSHFSKTNCQLRDWEGMKIQAISLSQHVRKNISDMFQSTLGVGAGSGVWHRQRVPDLSAWRAENIRFSAVALPMDGTEYAWIPSLRGSWLSNAPEFLDWSTSNEAVLFWHPAVTIAQEFQQ